MIYQEAHFKNIKEHIIKYLENANHTIIIAIAWFTDKEIIHTLEKCADKNVNISILIDENNINKKIRFQKLFQKGARIRSYTGGELMHNKFCIIDNRIIINGSFNWTENAQINNKENILITHNNYDLVNKFKDEFEKLYSISSDIEKYKLIYIKDDLWRDEVGAIYSKTYRDYDYGNEEYIVLVSCEENIKSLIIKNFCCRISRNAFKNCKKITRITIPNSIRIIEEGTFENCELLESVEIPCSIDKIPKKCFYNCKNLKRLTIPNKVKAIGISAFDGCESLDSIEIPRSIDEIPNWCFNNCKKLRKVTIPDSVKKIGSRAFDGCESLDSIEIPRSIDEIPNQCFYRWKE